MWQRFAEKPESLYTMYKSDIEDDVLQAFRKAGGAYEKVRPYNTPQYYLTFPTGTLMGVPLKYYGFSHYYGCMCPDGSLFVTSGSSCHLRLATEEEKELAQKNKAEHW